MIKEEDSFQLGKPWRHASVLSLSHPVPSQALNTPSPLAPQEKLIMQYYPFPQHVPQGMEWNGQVTFIAEVIICISSSNEALAEIQMEQIWSIEQKRENDEM